MIVHDNCKVIVNCSLDQNKLIYHNEYVYSVQKCVVER